MTEPLPEDRTVKLRLEFDAGFAKPLAGTQDDGEQMLTIRAGEDLLALRLAGVAGTTLCPRLTLVPSRNPALLGIGRVREALVAVFSIATLLDGSDRPGNPGQRRAHRWLVLCAEDPSVALAFDVLTGCLRISPGQRTSVQGQHGANSFDEVVEIDGTTRPVVSTRRLLARIDALGSAGRES